MDTLASIETGCPRLIVPSDLAAFRLPSPDRVWNAATSMVWADEVPKYRSLEYDLGRAMRTIYAVEGFSVDVLQPGRCLTGPFFWLVIVLVLTRELMDLGEGKRRDRECCPWAGDVDEDSLKEEIAKALERVRVCFC